MDDMIKFRSTQMKTFGFEEVITGLQILSEMVPLGRKCRAILEYDPATEDVKIETFIDKSDGRRAQERFLQEIRSDPSKM